ncbi:hypothetical protein HPP92_027149 [Vanilla planifolia]|uniref:Uncharacterized protein n=1 Tax=Vanilla planifolia TaxID=51239 RepID=A0A835PDK4_VANPL|nr:hypothetical protein HPP92_027149 [Vanilla planifolia]
MSFVSDSYYDYENLWHGLSAVVPFMAWHGRKRCEKPERWVLYHRGELRVQMSPWVSSLVEAVLGEEPRIEDYAEAGDGPYCFEKAVVFRHNEGEMKGKRKAMVYEMMRCKSRVSCGLLNGGEGGEGVVRVTLLLRTGARSFKDEKGVLNVFHSECRKVDRCRLTVARSDNLTFL